MFKRWKQKEKKSLGQKKGNLSIDEKHDLIRVCTDIAELTKRINNLESMAILETSLTYIVGHLDLETRDSLFRAANLIIDARQNAERRCLVTPAMVKRLKDDKDNIYTGLVAKSVVDLLVETAKTYHIDQITKDHIFKAVVIRLALELGHDTLEATIQQLIPAKNQKWRTNTRHMYG